MKENIKGVTKQQFIKKKLKLNVNNKNNNNKKIERVA